MNLIRRITYCAAALTLLISGCSKSSPFGAVPAAQPTSSFPVYSPSTVDTVGKYDDSSDVTQLGSSFFGQGSDAAYPYIGTQELLKTSASMVTLQGWITHLVQSPPSDLFPGTAKPTQDDAKADKPFVDALTTFGLVPVELSTKDRSRVVMLIVLDPKLVASRASAVLDLIDMYEKLPAPLRGSVEQSTKKLVGFSASDLTNTNTPMGMIIYAAKNWKGEDTRAIILVDATRQPNPLPTPHSN
jgi:hypothetical protein